MGLGEEFYKQAHVLLGGEEQLSARRQADPVQVAQDCYMKMQSAMTMRGFQ